jgi:hypothetical protein
MIIGNQLGIFKARLRQFQGGSQILVRSEELIDVFVR